MGWHADKNKNSPVGLPSRCNDKDDDTDDHNNEKHSEDSKLHEPPAAEKDRPAKDPQARNEPSSDSSNDDVDSNPANKMEKASDQNDEQDDDEIEPWHIWVQRATRIAEQCLKDLSIEDWVVQQRRRKFRWCHRVATQASNRWSKLVVEWQPQLNTAQRGKRRTGHPRKRWSDDISEFLNLQHAAHGDAKQTWHELAKDGARWFALEHAFANASPLGPRSPHPSPPMGQAATPV